MIHLELDTETNGFRESRMASVSMALVRDWRVVHEFTAVVQPVTWFMEPGATAKNGLTDEFLAKNGLFVRNVLDMVDAILTVYESPVVVAHQVSYDVERVLLNEYHIAGRENALWRLPRRCTMEGMRDWCRIPLSGGKTGYKMPNLGEAYLHAFGIELAGAHGAKADREACGRLHAWLCSKELEGDERTAALAYAFNGLPPAKPVIAEDNLNLEPAPSCQTDLI